MTNLRALRDLAPPPVQKRVEGLAHLISFKPDATAPQSFVVGVIVQTEDLSECQYRVLQDGHKFKGIYGQRILLEDIHWALEELEQRVAHAANKKSPVSEWSLGSTNFRIEPGRYTSGASLTAMVSRAFEHAVVMARSQHEKRFESRSTASVRLLVAEQLKLLAGIRYEEFAVNGVPFEFNGRKGFYDVTHCGAGQVATVVSGWASSGQTLRTALWHANSEVTTCAKTKDAEAGIFLLFPTEPTGIQPDVWRNMNEFLTDESAKLESSGLRVVAMPTTEELAEEVWSWYRPRLQAERP